MMAILFRFDYMCYTDVPCLCAVLMSLADMMWYAYMIIMKSQCLVTVMRQHKETFDHIIAEDRS